MKAILFSLFIGLHIPLIMAGQQADLKANLEFVNSDESFDYYTIKITNNRAPNAYILYDPAAFNPKDKFYNRLYCGFHNETTKTYTAILYHVDHLEISKELKIEPETCHVLYVKWDKKYADWDKKLSLLYYSAKNDSELVINDVDAQYIELNFPKKDQ